MRGGHPQTSVLWHSPHEVALVLHTADVTPSSAAHRTSSASDIDFCEDEQRTTRGAAERGWREIDVKILIINYDLVAQQPVGAAGLMRTSQIASQLLTATAICQAQRNHEYYGKIS